VSTGTQLTSTFPVGDTADGQTQRESLILQALTAALVRHPKMVSSQGSFDPVFPNAGKVSTYAGFPIPAKKGHVAESGPVVDPSVPVSASLESSRPSGLLIGGGVGLVASLIFSLGIPATIGATLLGAFLGKSRD